MLLPMVNLRRFCICHAQLIHRRLIDFIDEILGISKFAMWGPATALSHDSYTYELGIQLPGEAPGDDHTVRMSRHPKSATYVVSSHPFIPQPSVTGAQTQPSLFTRMSSDHSKSKLAANSTLGLARASEYLSRIDIRSLHIDRAQLKGLPYGGSTIKGRIRGLI